MDYIIDEIELFEYLDNSKNVLLIEPDYIRQYKPLGLAKIASYIKSKNGKVTYSRTGIIGGDFDLICITTLFTTDSKIVIQTIKECQRNIFLNNTPIIVGGIFASLMPEFIHENTKVKIFKGYSKKLDCCIPDYSINWQIKKPWDNSMIVFTTRGCPNKCGYCMVWRMEPDFYIQPNWKKSITENNFELAIVSDNNFLAANIEHIEEVVKVLIDKKKKVIFNNAVDVRLLTEEKAELLSKIIYSRNGRPGLRFAFDRMQDDGYYQKACELMIKKLNKKNLNGIGLSYVLFNFNDTPQEAYYRSKECWKYKSFPYLMKYRPLNALTKKEKFIGKYWTKNLVRAFELWRATYGFNTGDKKFETWANNNNKNRIELTNEDWDKWYYKKENNE
jgi:hypothetical protein